MISSLELLNYLTLYITSTGWTLGIAQWRGGLADCPAGLDALEVSAQTTHRAVQTVAPVQRISRNRNTALSAQLPGIAGWSDLWLPFNHVPSAIHHVLEIRS